MKRTIRQFFSVFMITVFLFFASGCGGDSTPEKRTSITKHEAKAVAEGQVETLLKSPSTADFSGLRDTKITHITHGYKVVGYVDSQNSFGATIRSTYSEEIYLDKASGNIMYKNLNVK
jgi:hypothetical protein